VAGLLGTLSLVRRGRSRARRGREGEPGLADADRGMALACCSFFVTGAVILLASDVPEFSWRYQLPAIVTLPPAGALGIAVILAWARSRRTRRAAADSPASPPALQAAADAAGGG
jgi:hypothetical protein